MNMCNLIFCYHLVCNVMTFKYVCLLAMNRDYIRILITGVIWFLGLYLGVGYWQAVGFGSDSLFWNTYTI